MSVDDDAKAGAAPTELPEVLARKCKDELDAAVRTGVERHLHRAGAFLEAFTLLTPTSSDRVDALRAYYESAATDLNVAADFAHGV